MPSADGYKNLKPAKKGEVRNPAGRPKRIGFIGELIREHLQQTITDPKSKFKGHPRIDEAIQKLYEEDKKTYFAYGFGKPIETQVQLTGDEQNKEFVKEVAREWARTGVDPRSKEAPKPQE